MVRTFRLGGVSAEPPGNATVHKWSPRFEKYRRAHRLTGPEPRVYRAPSLPNPPGHLSAEARRRWRALVAEYDLRDEGAQQVLRLALEALDRALSSTAAIAAEGTTFKDRFGQPRPHPLLAVERDARGQFLAGLRVLNLDLNRCATGRVGPGEDEAMPTKRQPIARRMVRKVSLILISSISCSRVTVTTCSKSSTTASRR